MLKGMSPDQIQKILEQAKESKAMMENVIKEQVEKMIKDRNLVSKEEVERMIKEALGR